MHISEGVVSLPVLVTGAVFAVAGVAKGLQQTHYDRLPAVACLSSAFFIASLIHVPLGISSVHLILNGLVGIILGWAAFPAILVALVLQAVFFGFGGFTALGVNTVVMALPAVMSYYLFNRPVALCPTSRSFFYGFTAGALSILLSVFLVGAALFFSGREFIAVIKIVSITHIPIMVIEGCITGFTVVFLKKVKPQLFSVSLMPGQSKGDAG